MHIDPRLIRAEAENERLLPSYPSTPQEWARHEAIIETARNCMAKYGASSMRLTDFALALRMSTFTLRRHFIDFHALLAEIIRRHLLDVSTAIGAIPRDDPLCLERRRCAYFAATRTPFGAFTAAHLLTVRDRTLLPEDLLVCIDQIRLSIVGALAGSANPATVGEALTLLDSTEIEPARIRQILQTLAATPQAPLPEPLELPKRPAGPTAEEFTPTTEFVLPADWERPWLERQAAAKAEAEAKQEAIETIAQPAPDPHLAEYLRTVPDAELLGELIATPGFKSSPRAPPAAA